MAASIYTISANEPGVSNSRLILQIFIHRKFAKTRSVTTSLHQ